MEYGDYQLDLMDATVDKVINMQMDALEYQKLIILFRVLVSLEVNLVCIIIYYIFYIIYYLYTNSYCLFNYSVLYIQIHNIC